MALETQEHLACPRCRRQFSRGEHLTRHLRSHANERPYQCGSCGKAFNRCDLLNRHRRTNCLTVTRDRAKPPRSRGRSACDSCAKAKLRCSSSVPCGRCLKKGIPCEKKTLERSSNLTEAAEALPENAPYPQPTSSHQQQQQQQQYTDDRDVIPDLFSFSAPQLPAIPALRMDFLDLPTFPVNTGNIDLQSISEEKSGIVGQVDGDDFANYPLRIEEGLPGLDLPSTSDSWNKYKSSGMIQTNLWNKTRPRGLMQPQENPDSVWDTLRGSEGTERSLLNLLSLEDILAMEDHGHVATVGQEQMDELASFMAMNQDRRTLSCPPHYRELLNKAEVINAFVQLYFEHFHPTFPFLHRATFNGSKVPPLLLLATATVGSRFSKIPQAHSLSTVLGDILRKAIDNLLDNNIDQTIQIPFAQSAVLNQIQTAYHGSKRLTLKAQFQRSMLVTVCRGINSKVRREDMHASLPNGNSPHDLVVSRWVDRELNRRLTYGIWLLDCQFSLNAGVQTMMSLEDLETSLPCQEATWDLDMASLAEKLMDPDGGPRTLRLEDALDTSKLAAIIALQNPGLFARSIIMMAMYYQWQIATSVNRYILQGPDERDEPGSSLDAEFMGDSLIPNRRAITSVPLVSVLQRAQWRSAASEAIGCICKNMDTWRESESSQLLKLHRHISILVNVPLTPLCDYVGWMSTKACMAVARESLCSWIRADVQNARRTVMHAIALFCLIRKRKLAGHSENHHLFLAFLVIWTFFSLDPLARPADVPSDVPGCTVDWDGQVDSDAHEMWIRASGHPPLRLAGVGDLGEVSSLRRILVETHRVLLSDQMWGINQLFANVLEGLISRGSAMSVA
ncbi:fungal-specific transcription factor domain-containing protein [Aspergillus pseudocaelatus]|uniref:Fungal-specific transcription factor domain-containing protein n=1 Tax=Aspergillus pseudocaelatus TaxID=1825620 RepID=A0ABQ6WFQ2_9EURO|nr:fungal-specific transcription factor domain-containing protein [Aspergillus pseudocaelatus]